MTQLEPNQVSACPACANWWRLPLLLALVLGAIVMYRAWRPGESLLHVRSIETVEVDKALVPASEGVALAVDFGMGRPQSFPVVAWQEGMSVADLLSQTPELRIVQKGSAAATFLVSINGIANEGTDGRNWTFEVNGQPADRSFAVYELRPGDRVLWSFGSRR